LYTQRWDLTRYGYFNPKVDNERDKNASLEGFEPTTSGAMVLVLLLILPISFFF
jgi:hypothetical protein